MVDPLSGNIYIVSKREANVQLYQITYPYSTTDTVIAKKMITLPFTQIVAGDISADGKNILLKNYQKVWYWSRKDGTSIVDALSKTLMRHLISKSHKANLFVGLLIQKLFTP